MAGAARKRRPAGPAPTIVLIGLRGSGKSTVGPIVAHRLGRQFIDLDSVTLWRLGAASVDQAWRERGVAAFRATEAMALAEALEQPARVIASGGGTPTAPGSADLLRDRGRRGLAFIVYLRETPGVLRTRLGGADENRPSLTGRGVIDEIDEVFAARDPLYRSLASLVIEKSASPEDAAERITIAACGE
ncbi:MAG: shikimate kinase [Planctomycetota bacterium]|nr:MAG: shikimate kinase [Planctomycetota bacterium]